MSEPVLWVCEHFLARQSLLHDSGQPRLPFHGAAAGRTPTAGAGDVRGPDGQTPGEPLDGSRQGEPEDMDQDKDKRRGREPGQAGDDNKAKWAKGEAKGENKTEEAPQTGKGGQQAQQAQPTRPTTTQQGSSPGRSSGQGQGAMEAWNRQQRQWSQKDDRWPKQGRKDNLRDLVNMIGRLVLRLEDAQAVMNLDNEFVLFLQSGASQNQLSVTSALYEVACDWHEKKTNNPSSLNQPMRSVLMYSFLACLLERLNKMEQDSDFYEAAKTKGLVENTRYLFLQWDPQQKRRVKAQQDP